VAGVIACLALYGVATSSPRRFPNEKTYRHSLLEEVDALNTAAAVLGENYKKPKQRKNLQPSLLTLLELNDKGMIEPFVLISKPDAGIAQDLRQISNRSIATSCVSTSASGSSNLTSAAR